MVLCTDVWVRTYVRIIDKVFTIGLTWRRAGSSDRNACLNLSSHTYMGTLNLKMVVGHLVLITSLLVHDSALGSITRCVIMQSIGCTYLWLLSRRNNKLLFYINSLRDGDVSHMHSLFYHFARCFVRNWTNTWMKTADDKAMDIKAHYLSNPGARSGNSPMGITRNHSYSRNTRWYSIQTL
jgi:hypothetical protein